METVTNFAFVLSLILALIAILSVFIWIPLVGEYDFWFVIAACAILAGSREYYFNDQNLSHRAGGHCRAFEYRPAKSARRHRLPRQYAAISAWLPHDPDRTNRVAALTLP